MRPLLIVLGLLAVEATSFGLYWARLGHPHLSEAARDRLDERARAGDGAMELPGHPAAESVQLVPHPFRGVINNPLAMGGVSEDGVQVLDGPVPLERDPSRLVVGLFGGSVAWELGSSTERPLQRAFAEAGLLADRELTLVVAAIPADKQPSQLFALEYLQLRGYRFDVVLNLDGFNEIVNSADLAGAGGSPLYPHMYRDLLATFESPEMVARTGALRLLREERAESARWLASSAFRLSPTASLLFELRDGARAAEIARLRTELQERSREGAYSYAQLGPRWTGANPYEDVEPVAREMAVVWSETSRRMHEVATHAGARYLHFLQPNQYDPEHRRAMSDEERRVAWGDPRFQPYERWIEAGYPLLRARVDELRGAGVTFVDLGDVYREHEEPIYRDICCHVNERGYELLARAVAEHTRDALR